MYGLTKMSARNRSVEKVIDRTILGRRVFQVYRGGKLGYLTIGLLLLGMSLMSTSIVNAQGEIQSQGSTSVTAGSIRQRELLAFRNEEIERLRKKLMDTEAELDQLRLQLQSKSNQSDSVDQNAIIDSLSSKEISSSIVIEQGESIALGNRWFVTVSPQGPSNYIDLVKARAIQSPLPTESDCETFSVAFEQNSELLGKLKINGFPITSFWALGSNGKLKLCRVNRVSSQRFRAAISSATPSRSDKAIALVSK